MLVCLSEWDGYAWLEVMGVVSKMGIVESFI